MRKQIRRPWLVAVDPQLFRLYGRIGNQVVIDVWTDPDQAFVWQPNGRLGYLPGEESRLLRKACGFEAETVFATILDVRDEYHEGGPAVRLEYTLPEPAKRIDDGLSALALHGAGVVTAVAFLSAAWLVVRWWMRGG